MGRIIPLPTSRHADIYLLLPWYVTGSLPSAERRLVEAHVAGCAACYSELKLEERLRGALRDLPYASDAGWMRLRSRILRDRAGRFSNLRRRFLAMRRLPAWVGWGLAGGQAVLLAGALLLPTTAPEARYATLGEPPSPPRAGIVVVFRPDTTERQLRTLIRAADAQLVGGPTAADAYLLASAQGDEDEVLAHLRRRPEVTFAAQLQPADASDGGAR